MKKLLGVLAISLTAASCGGTASEPTETTTGADDGSKALIYASNYPLAYFTECIATPVAEVRFPVPDNEDPAFWKPSLDDVVAMQRADLVVLNGASYESWLANVSLPPSRLVDTTAGLAERLIPLATETTHSHGLEGEHEHSGTAFTTWLDPTLAAAQATAIQQALAARWPGHAAQLEAQLAELVAELTALDAAAREAVGGNSALPVLFSHPVYQYLARRYGLNARSVHWEPDQVPDEEQWAQLSTILAEFPAAWMIWEDTPLPEVSNRLESLGVRTAVFDPCATTPGSGDFVSTMEANLQSLRTIFAGNGGRGPQPPR